MRKILIFSFFICSILNASKLANDIHVKSDLIQFNQRDNLIIFSNNVEINSNHLTIIADEAKYDNEKEVITVKGIPSTIDSYNQKNKFRGKAKEIIFYSDEEVHLIGDASLKYENISISSKTIIFNPLTGDFKSNK